MGPTRRFMSSVSYFVSSRFTTAFRYSIWPGTAQSVMWLPVGCTDTITFVAGTRMFLITITLFSSALGSNCRRISFPRGKTIKTNSVVKWVSLLHRTQKDTVLKLTLKPDVVCDSLSACRWILELCPEVCDDYYLAHTLSLINLGYIPFDAVQQIQSTKCGREPNNQIRQTGEWNKPFSSI
jgi:hypothetical protein